MKYHPQDGPNSRVPKRSEEVGKRAAGNKGDGNSVDASLVGATRAGVQPGARARGDVHRAVSRPASPAT